MGSLRQRSVILKAVAMKMLEEGKFLTKHEYDDCLSVPIRSALVLNSFSNWSRLITIMRAEMPDVVAQIEAKNKPVTPPPKPAPTPAPKPKASPLSASPKATETKDGTSNETV